MYYISTHTRLSTCAKTFSYCIHALPLKFRRPWWIEELSVDFGLCAKPSLDDSEFLMQGQSCNILSIRTNSSINYQGLTESTPWSSPENRAETLQQDGAETSSLNEKSKRQEREQDPRSVEMIVEVQVTGD